jgi:hypothetical protein
MKTAALILTSLCITVSAHGQRPDFSGRWTLDSTIVLGGGRGDAYGNASGGGGGGGGGTGLGPAADALNVVQDDSTLVVQEISGDSTLAITYRFNRKATENTMSIGRDRTTKASFRSRWDNTRLVTSIARTIPAPGNRETRLEYRETRSLSPDGSMVVETVMVGRPAGRRAIYRKSQY